ncbi:hypothetical protein ALP92_200013 [Pseudomonas syringae pv. primulae]|uniref:Uncharacterized protein n=1 Tax=Pseudomonas syringae pv. primulae TaxID=251707 RepID=A0A3M4RRP4_9PSED|nr:hypothetical protein ALP92_200013 [Pseudomonas syringae pv. primulae]
MHVKFSIHAVTLPLKSTSPWSAEHWAGLQSRPVPLQALTKLLSCVTMIQRGIPAEEC